MRLRHPISVATSALLAAVSLLAFSLGSCTVTEPIEFGEERSRVVTSIADSLIIPGYTELAKRVDSLVEVSEAFAVFPDSANLEVLRSMWLRTLLAWESASLYELGPAVNAFGTLTSDIATFPASEQKLEDAIAAGDTSTQNFDRDKRGFFAMEYLIFGGDNQAFFRADSVNRRNYLLVVARHLQKSVRFVRDEWVEYRTEFVKQIGTDAGSAMGLLFNALNISYEQAKNFKIALPAGRRLGQPQSPHLVEAYYSRNSLRALKAHLRSVFDLWRGNEPARLGFRYYLGFVSNGDRLIADTENQMDSLNAALDRFGDEEVLSDLIVANDTRIDALVEHSQKMSRFLKSEMSSLIGIAITYSSGDGD